MISTEHEIKTGLQLQQSGRLDEARRCYQKVLRVDPQHADANHLLGLMAYHSGRHNEAVMQIQKALARRPASAVFLNSIGAAYQALGRHSEAQAVFEQATRIQPRHVAAHNNLGAALFALGKFTEAEKCYHRALELNPDFADAHINLGNVHNALGRFDQAEQSLRTALRIAPQNALAWNNLGNAYKSRDRSNEAAECYRKAIGLNPSLAMAWGNLGLTLQARGDWESALEVFDRSFELRAAPGLLIKCALALPVILDSVEQLQRARDRFDARLETLLQSDIRLDDPMRDAGVGAFHLAYHGSDDRDRYRRMAQMFLRACPALNYVAPHCRVAAADTAGVGLGPTPPSASGATPADLTNPIRVGFISHYFYNHSVGLHYGGLVRHLSRDRFRVLLLRFPGPDDKLSRMIDAGADEVVTLSPDLAHAREQIAALKLDVLYYTDIGMDPLTYFLAFSRLAPVQCVTNGHPVTTGIPNVDYFMSCSAIEPADAQRHYTERLILMENIPNFYERPRPSGPARRRRDFGLADDWHVYLCTQNLCKLHPDFDPLLGEILHRDPQGRVIFIHGLEPAWSDRLAARFSRSIPHVAARIGFLPHQSNDQFLHLLTLADCILDSTHFSGGTTTAQALAVGAPIVTLPGEFMRGRITAGCYQKMGLFDCVARDREEYVRIALRLGTDPAFRAQTRSAILTRNSILYDNPGFIRELEDFLPRAVAERNAARSYHPRSHAQTQAGAQISKAGSDA